MKLIANILLLYLFPCIQGAGWSYYGQDDGIDHWGEKFPNCKGRRQSPIDIHPIFVKANESLADLSLTGYNQTDTMTLTAKNNGHTVQVDIDGDVYMENGGLPGRYNALQFHFHWGSDDMKGSEHLMTGRAFPLEMHIVHYAQDYGNVSVAIEKSDGLAAVGVFFEIGETDNPALNPLLDRLKNISNKGMNVAVDALTLSDLMPQNTAKFYRYLGSLTTPSCQESVIWTLLADTMKVSSEQMKKFRELSEYEPNSSHFAKIEDNMRPPQALNGRRVMSSFEEPKVPWGYKDGPEGPLYWKDHFSTCGGQKQSPVNIVTSKAVYDETLGDIVFDRWSHKHPRMTLRNNGHTAVVDIDGDMSISGGGLAGKYKTAQFHFHWGKENWRGSEHTVDGDAFPVELHIVHYSDQYSNLLEAAVQPKGLAVIGVFFEISESDNTRLTDFLNKLPSVPYEGTEHEFGAFAVTSILPETMKYYYRYSGSLTTPGCYESVIWTVYHETVKISQAQINKFRDIYKYSEEKLNSSMSKNAGKGATPGASYKLVDNFRPVQYKYGRTVSTNKKMDEEEEPGTTPVAFGLCGSSSLSSRLVIPIVGTALMGYFFSKTL